MVLLKFLGVILSLLFLFLLGGQFFSTKVDIDRPMIAMDDGVRLAADVLLPKKKKGEKFPSILIQTRYWRSFALRMPDSPNTIPPAPRDQMTEELVKAGYAVVIVDVRGTGASEGQWAYPWSQREVDDGNRLIDWIAAQPWSDGQVGATGVSYEGTTALLLGVHHNPHLKAILARQIEWDLFDDLVAPGGIKNLSFPQAWGETVADLDRNLYPPLFPSYAKYIVTGVHPSDEDKGGLRLKKIIKARKVADVAGDLERVITRSDPFGAEGNPSVQSLGPSAYVAALKTTNAAISLWGSWWDSTTAQAALKASEQLPQIQAVLGIWNHEGTGVSQPLSQLESAKDQLVNPKHIISFFDEHLKTRSQGSASSLKDKSLKRRWYTIKNNKGYWEGDATHWPRITERVFLLGGNKQLFPKGEVTDPMSTQANSLPLDFDISLFVDFGQSSGSTNRWMTGMLIDLKYEGRAKTGRSLLWQTEKLAADLAIFGSLRMKCEVSVINSNQEEREAAIHAYLDMIDQKGEVHYLTEGLLKTSTGKVEIDFMPLSFVLPRHSKVRLSVAGADRPTFEKIPVMGSSTLHFIGRSGDPCSLIIPEVKK